MVEYPPYLSRRQVHEYFESYAKHFQLHKHISFSTTVKQVLRNESEEKWDVHVTGPDGDETLSFDKVVFGNGCESVPVWPSMPGRDKFAGTILHSQAFRRSVTNIEWNMLTDLDAATILTTIKEKESWL